MNISCKDKNTIYLQQEDIKLVQPRVFANNTLIDSFVTLKADLKFDDSEVYYTTDGSEPSMENIKYVKPLKVTEEGVFKFRAFHSEWKPSKTIAITFYKKGHTPKEIIWYSEENKTYKGQGISTLINQKKADLKFKNPEWVGFDSIAKAKVIFSKKTFVKSIDVSFLIDTQSWIFPPEAISVFLDGEHKTTIKIDDLKSAFPTEMKLQNISINKEVESITLEISNLKSIPNWHEGKGNKAWLFMDEWIFN